MLKEFFLHQVEPSLQQHAAKWQFFFQIKRYLCYFFQPFHQKNQPFHNFEGASFFGEISWKITIP